MNAEKLRDSISITPENLLNAEGHAHAFFRNLSGNSALPIDASLRGANEN